MDVELLLSAIANQKIQLSNLDPGLALGRAYLFFFLIFQWVVIISSTVPSGDMMDFQHALIIDMDGRPGLRLQKGLLLLRADRLLAGGGLVGLAWRGIFFFDTNLIESN